MLILLLKESFSQKKPVNISHPDKRYCLSIQLLYFSPEIEMTRGNGSKFAEYDLDRPGYNLYGAKNNANNEPVYIVELNSKPGFKYSFSQFKTEPKYKNAILIINSNIGPNVNLTLPDHIPTFIMGSIHPTAKIYGRKPAIYFPTQSDLKAKSEVSQHSSLSQSAQSATSTSKTDLKRKRQENEGKTEQDKPVIRQKSPEDSPEKKRKLEPKNLPAVTSSKSIPSAPVSMVAKMPMGSSVLQADSFSSSSSASMSMPSSAVPMVLSKPVQPLIQRPDPKDDIAIPKYFREEQNLLQDNRLALYKAASQKQQYLILEKLESTRFSNNELMLPYPAHVRGNYYKYIVNCNIPNGTYLKVHSAFPMPIAFLGNIGTDVKIELNHMPCYFYGKIGQNSVISARQMNSRTPLKNIYIVKNGQLEQTLSSYSAQSLQVKDNSSASMEFEFSDLEPIVLPKPIIVSKAKKVVLPQGPLKGEEQRKIGTQKLMAWLETMLPYEKEVEDLLGKLKKLALDSESIENKLKAFEGSAANSVANKLERQKSNDNSEDIVMAPEPEADKKDKKESDGKDAKETKETQETLEQQLKENDSAYQEILNNLKAVIKQYQVRPHQYRSLKSYTMKARIENTNPDSVFELATGAGKAFIIAKYPEITGERVLVLAPKNILIPQLAQSFKDFSPKVKVGVIDRSQSHERISRNDIQNIIDNSQVVITTYQFLDLMIGQQKRYETLNFERMSMVIGDEGHNSMSASKITMLEYFKKQGLGVLLFTATAEIGKALKGGINNAYELLGFNPDGSDNPVPPYPIRDAILEGANAPVVTTLFIPKGTDNITFKRNSSDEFSDTDVAQKINQPKYNKMIAQAYLNESDPVTNVPYRGMQAILFGAGVNHAKALKAEFDKLSIDQLDPDGRYRNAYANTIAKEAEQRLLRNWQERYFKKPVDSRTRAQFDVQIKNEREEAYKDFSIAEVVFAKTSQHSDTSKDKNQKIINKFKKGGCFVLAGADMLTEGFDHPAVSLVICAGPTHTLKILKQRIGRGTRVDEQNPNKICYVQDWVWGSASESRRAYEVISDYDRIHFNWSPHTLKRCRMFHKSNTHKLPEIVPIFLEDAHGYDALWEPTIISNSSQVIQIRGNAKCPRELTLGPINRKVKDKIITIKSLPITQCVLKLKSSIDNLTKALSALKSLSPGGNVAVEILSSFLMGEAPESNAGTVDQEPKPLKIPGRKKPVASDEIGCLILNAEKNLKKIANTFLIKAKDKPAKNEKVSEKNITAKAKTKEANERLQKLSKRYEALRKTLSDALAKAVSGQMSSNSMEDVSTEPNKAGTLSQVITDIEMIQKEFKELYDYFEKEFPPKKQEKSSQKPKKIQKEAAAIKYVPRLEDKKPQKGVQKKRLAEVEDWIKTNPDNDLAKLLKNEQNLSRATRENIAFEMIKRNPAILNNTVTRNDKVLQNWELLLDAGDYNSFVTVIDVKVSDSFNNGLLHRMILNLKNHNNEWRYGSEDSNEDKVQYEQKSELNVMNSFLELLNRGIDINKTNNEGDTPLHIAIRHRLKIITMLLLSYNARIDIPNKKMLSVENIVQNKEFDKEKQFRFAAIFQKLINKENIGNWNIQDERGQTLAHMLTDNHFSVTLKHLLQKPINLCLQDEAGDTPLHIAAVPSEASHKESHHIIKCILAVSLKTNVFSILNNEGHNPLQEAFCHLKRNAIRGLKLLLNTYNEHCPKILADTLNAGDSEGDAILHNFLLALGDNTSPVGIDSYFNFLKELLLDLVRLGAKFTQTNLLGQTPLDAYFQKYQTRLLGRIGDLTQWNEKGLNVFASERHSNTNRTVFMSEHAWYDIVHEKHWHWFTETVESISKYYQELNALSPVFISYNETINALETKLKKLAAASGVRPMTGYKDKSNKTQNNNNSNSNGNNSSHSSSSAAEISLVPMGSIPKPIPQNSLSNSSHQSSAKPVSNYSGSYPLEGYALPEGWYGPQGLQPQSHSNGTHGYQYQLPQQGGPQGLQQQSFSTGSQAHQSQLPQQSYSTHGYQYQQNPNYYAPVHPGADGQAHQTPTGMPQSNPLHNNGHSLPDMEIDAESDPEDNEGDFLDPSETENEFESGDVEQEDNDADASPDDEYENGSMEDDENDEDDLDQFYDPSYFNQGTESKYTNEELQQSFDYPQSSHSSMSHHNAPKPLVFSNFNQSSRGYPMSPSVGLNDHYQGSLQPMANQLPADAYSSSSSSSSSSGSNQPVVLFSNSSLNTVMPLQFPNFPSSPLGLEDPSLSRSASFSFPEGDSAKMSDVSDLF